MKALGVITTSGHSISEPMPHPIRESDFSGHWGLQPGLQCLQLFLPDLMMIEEGLGFSDELFTEREVLLFGNELQYSSNKHTSLTCRPPLFDDMAVAKIMIDAVVAAESGEPGTLIR
jgi:hypothetical protein